MNKSVLHRPSGSPALSCGRLVFSIDATASRQRAWHIARDLQAHMFIEAGSVGMLNLQLVYFQGTVCRASRWASRGEELARWMSTIQCETGVTQIERVLRHSYANMKERRCKESPLSAMPWKRTSVCWVLWPTSWARQACRSICFRRETTPPSAMRSAYWR
jgi:hypothetical protein